MALSLAGEQARPGQEAALPPIVEENMPPRPGTTSMISCVCFQASNWLALM